MTAMPVPYHMRLLLLSLLLLLCGAASAQSLPIPLGLPIGSSPIRFTRLRGNPNVLEGHRIAVTFITDSAVTARFGQWDSVVDPSYEQLFISRFTREAASHHIRLVSDTAHTTWHLTVRTTRLDRGFDEGLVSRPAFIDVLLDFRNEQDRTVALLRLERIPGQVFGFDNGFTRLRVAQCYNKLGQVLYNRILDFFPITEPAREEQ